MKLSNLAERMLYEIYKHEVENKEKRYEITSDNLGVSSKLFIDAWRELVGENKEEMVYIKARIKEFGTSDNLCARLVECSISEDGKEYIIEIMD
ncbi:hypothetical protein SAMN05216582_11315 [Selenomonas ruminantium]|uniref:Uncharacterized protein n=1 Tax=Selenomonas ruminantium TaxID=971 RepID=A0A1M6UKV9_SELRU|nr:hypothetical protein [Selenomonas ruminantium]SHK69831.1 hypothetical protein SAMN05216582_11315 [Selenomonas ruminantium]